MQHNTFIPLCQGPISTVVPFWKLLYPSVNFVPTPLWKSAKPPSENTPPWQNRLENVWYGRDPSGKYLVCITVTPLKVLVLIVWILNVVAQSTLLGNPFIFFFKDIPMYFAHFLRLTKTWTALTCLEHHVEYFPHPYHQLDSLPNLHTTDSICCNSQRETSVMLRSTVQSR